jgi:hypothetical protein
MKPRESPVGVQSHWDIAGLTRWLDAADRFYGSPLEKSFAAAGRLFPAQLHLL